MKTPFITGHSKERLLLPSQFLTCKALLFLLLFLFACLFSFQPVVLRKYSGVMLQGEAVPGLRPVCPC